MSPADLYEQAVRLAAQAALSSVDAVPCAEALERLAPQLALYSHYGPAIARTLAQALRQGESARWALPALAMYFQEDLRVFLCQRPMPDGLARRCSEQVESLRTLRADLPALLAQPYAYDVTIAVTAYNKLSYTRLAVESIFRHTDLDQHRIELLLIDNGSTDGTDAYFASVPGARCLRLPEALGYPATSLGPLVARGRYYVHFANDIIATPRWLEGLLGCARDDPYTGLVVPVCNAMSSGQSIPVPYGDPREDLAPLIAFAEEHNHPDPRLWEQRGRLLPCMSLMPTAVARACLNDPLFCYGEFADDDVSTRLRRSGYRQVLARDTFVHHFGSVTAASAQRQAQTLPESRALYREKWGVDAWSSQDWDDALAVQAAAALPKARGCALWIDPAFGASLFACRNACRQTDKQPPALCALVTDSRYAADAYGMAQRVVCAPLREGLARLQGQTAFDVIVWRDDLSKFDAQTRAAVWPLLYALLRPGGAVLCFAKNAQALGPLALLARQTLRAPYDEDGGVFPVDLYELKSAAETAGFQPSFTSVPLALSSEQCAALAKIANTGPEALPPTRALCRFIRPKDA